jgi:RNA polymerase sigma-70 factor (ECF subfamily)
MDAPLSPAAVDRDAEFRALFRAQCGYVIDSLRRLGVAPADVDDMAQEVFLVAFRHHAQYDRARPIRPWLFAFAAGIASNYRRLARHRREAAPADDVAADSAPSADEGIDAARDRELVIEALGLLGPDRSAVLILADIDGVPVPEIAAALKVPLNTAYSRLRLAREEFTAAARRLLARRGRR